MGEKRKTSIKKLKTGGGGAVTKSGSEGMGGGQRIGVGSGQEEGKSTQGRIARRNESSVKRKG